MPKPLGGLLSFRARGLIGGHRRGWIPPIVEAVVSHLDLTDRDQEDHPKYGPLAVANAWAALQTFNSGIIASQIGGPFAPAGADTFLAFVDTTGPATRRGLVCDIGVVSAGGANFILGVSGNAVSLNPATNSAYGLWFEAGCSTVNLASATVARLAGKASGAGRTLSALYNLYIYPPSVAGATIAVSYGVIIGSQLAAVASRPMWEPSVPTAGHYSVMGATLQLFSFLASFGGGVGVLGIANATTVPTSNPVGGGALYASAGALYWRGSGGTVTLIAAA